MAKKKKEQKTLHLQFEVCLLSAAATAVCWIRHIKNWEVSINCNSQRDSKDKERPIHALDLYQHNLQIRCDVAVMMRLLIW